MDVLKCFYEEPAPLVALAGPEEGTGRGLSAPAEGSGSLDALLGRGAEASPYARLYLAGTRLPESQGERPLVGLTALRDASLYTAPLLALGPGGTWTACLEGGAYRALLAPEAAALLARPGGVRALACGPGAGVPEGLLAPAAEPDRRVGARALRVLLDARPEALVLLPEPAHDGHDWSVWAARRLREPFVAALRNAPAPGARRFVLPYGRARGEHTFYFEQWQLGALPAHVEEV